ncbi:uncharacterized protein LOC119025282 isoform X2 [Acanthopagrus latus]|uniref:uncharacterized protein LOC119025282 isoform X2 n=1 Tax=Acanthopagrus latus TaxID=8177 RepID=UPI00187BDEAC|nr:uncharacterized protein LOC119025282 isoform X2 [Acanthopagrus latus]
MTEQPRAAGEGDQMEEDTTQQDAASGSVKCPERRSSGPPAADQAEEKVQPEQVDVDPEILKTVRDVMSASHKYALDDERLKKCITDASVDPKELSQFFKNVEAQHANTDRGQKLSWLSSWFWSKAQTVKVHSVSTGRTCGADDEILEKVKNMKWTQVEITGCQECDIIIVFCPITSLVRSDVSAAMREIPGDKPVILVLMHHTRDVDFSTDVKKWSGTYQNVKLDVHVLFHETQPGLLKCPRNDEAVQQIQTVLKAHSRRWLQWPSSGFNAVM